MPEPITHPRFGEEFKIDPTPRIKTPKADITQIPSESPIYSWFARHEVRSKLIRDLAKNGWPETPTITTVEDLYESAKRTVAEHWDQSVIHETSQGGEIQDGLLTKACKEWLGDLKGNLDVKDHPEIISILSSPTALEKSFALRQLSDLEPLRKLHPRAWRSLLMVSSERQLTELTLMHHWINAMPDEAFSKLGFSKTELLLFTDISGVLGKYFDEGFVKQLEVADLPGNETQSELARKGREGDFLIDRYNPKKRYKTDNLSLVDVFPYEFPKTSDRLSALASRTELLIQQSKLPSKYAELPSYLEHMSKTYGSTDTDPDTVAARWDKLYEHAEKLEKSGCPILVTLMGVSGVMGEAQKADVEVRVALQTNETMTEQSRCESYRNTAQQILDDFIMEHPTAVKESVPKIPSIFLSYQPTAFGPNLIRTTRSEADANIIVGHVNTIAQVARESELPLLHKVFPERSIGEQTYKKYSVHENMLYQMAHMVLNNEDKRIVKRVGKSREADILDGLKAETVAMKILLKSIGNNEMQLPEIEDHFSASLGELLDGVVHKSSDKGSDGEEYFVIGTTVIKRLMDKELLSLEDGQYKIQSSLRCIQEIASMGDEILEMYSSKSTTKDSVATYVDTLRTNKDDERVKEFIARAKS